MALISFDPNIRLPLWQSEDACRQAVREFLPLADIVKISDEELEFITGTDDLGQAKSDAFQRTDSAGSVYLRQPGAYALDAELEVFEPSLSVNALDTTGAGDGFIGSFLYQCARDHVADLSACSADHCAVTCGPAPPSAPPASNKRARFPPIQTILWNSGKDRPSY